MDEREKKESSVSFFGKNSQGGKVCAEEEATIQINPVKGAIPSTVCFDDGKKNESNFKGKSTLIIGEKIERQQEVKSEQTEQEEKPVFMQNLC